MKLDEPIPPDSIRKWRHRIGAVSLALFLVGLAVRFIDERVGGAMWAIGIVGLLLMFSPNIGGGIQTEADLAMRTSKWAYIGLAFCIAMIVLMILVTVVSG